MNLNEVPCTVSSVETMFRYSIMCPLIKTSLLFVKTSLALWSETIVDRFGTSERQWVEAQVKNAKQQAILMTFKAQVTSDEAHIHLDLHSLR